MRIFFFFGYAVGCVFASMTFPIDRPLYNKDSESETLRWKDENGQWWSVNEFGSDESIEWDSVEHVEFPEKDID